MRFIPLLDDFERGFFWGVVRLGPLLADLARCCFFFGVVVARLFLGEDTFGTSTL